MNFDVLNKIPFLQQQFERRLAYYSDALYAINDNKFDAVANERKRIVIVAKKHYSERWQAFSAINKTELKKLLAIKKQSSDQHHSIFQVTENNSIDGFDVKTIEFSTEIITTLGTGNVYIPETELFHQNQDAILAIETPAGMLFSSAAGNKVNNAYAKGIVANIETYRLSAGLPNDKPVNQVALDAFPLFLQACMQNLPLKLFSQKALINPKEWVNPNKLHWLYGAPLLTALAFYIITNSYLAFNIYSIESSLEVEGEQVASVLSQKQKIDKKVALYNLLSEELSGQRLTYYHWEIVHQMINDGATINRVTYKNGGIVVRGFIDKASELLAKVSENVLVESASFKGAVRKVRTSESFVIEILPKEPS